MLVKCVRMWGDGGYERRWKEEDRREKGVEREKRRHRGRKTREEAEQDRCPCTKHSMVNNIEENSD